MSSTAAVLSPDSPTNATTAYSGPSTPTAATHPSSSSNSDGKAVTGNRGDGKVEKRKPAGWRHFVAGGVGGMTGAIVTSPFDVVKTRLQSDLFRDSPSSSSSSSPPSSLKSTLNPASSTIPKPNAISGQAQKLMKPAFVRPGGASGLLWNFVETGQMIRNIYVQESPRALFKGLGPTLVGVVPARAINFSTYASSKTFLASHFPNVQLPSVSSLPSGEEKDNYSGEANPIVHLGAATIAGVTTATATNPIWVVKTRLQLEARHRKRSTPSSSIPQTTLAPSPSSKAYSTAARAASSTPAKDKMLPALRMTLDIVKKEGVVGLYRGMSASYLGVTEGVIQWVLYERLKRISTQTYPGQPARSKLAEWAGIVGSSGGAKMVASLITYPHEVIRTRLRQPEVNGKLKYTGLWQTLRLVIAEEGAASMYGGLSAHLMRVVPNAACMFTIYEIALRL